MAIACLSGGELGDEFGRPHLYRFRRLADATASCLSTGLRGLDISPRIAGDLLRAAGAGVLAGGHMVGALFAVAGSALLLLFIGIHNA